MRRTLLWLAALLPLSAASPVSVAAADTKASPGDRVFGAAKVVPFHLTMSDKDFTALAPAPRAGFGRGFGPPPKQAEGTHRNTFGIDLRQIPLADVAGY